MIDSILGFVSWSLLFVWCLWSLYMAIFKGVICISFSRAGGLGRRVQGKDYPFFYRAQIIMFSTMLALLIGGPLWLAVFGDRPL